MLRQICEHIRRDQYDQEHIYKAQGGNDSFGRQDDKNMTKMVYAWKKMWMHQQELVRGSQ